MASRTYTRDANGRFASGGGGGGSKAAATRKANAARKAELVARGTSQLGRRVKAKGFEGGAAAQKRAGGLRTGGSLRGVYKDRGKAMSGAMKGRVKRDGGAAAKLAASKSPALAKRSKPAKTSKAAPNKTKAAYKAATSKVRELRMYRGGKSDSVVKGAQAKVRRMEASRGVKKGPPKAVMAVAKAAAAAYAAGQTARAMMTGRRRKR